MRTSFMNLEILLRDDLNYGEKIVYHLIKDGLRTVAEMLDTGLNRQYLYKCLKKLIQADLVKNTNKGIYDICQAENERQPEATNCQPELTARQPEATTCQPGLSNCQPELSSRETRKGLNKGISQVEVKEKRDFEFSLKDLFDGIDFVGNERHRNHRAEVAHFLREKGLSPDLVDRISAANLKRIPGFDRPTLQEVLSEARDSQKAGFLQNRWFRIAAYARNMFERNGIEWTKCRPPSVARADEQIADGQNRMVKSTVPVGDPTPTPVAHVPIERVSPAELHRRQQAEKAGAPLISPDEPPSVRAAKAELWASDFMETARRIEAGTEEIDYSGTFDYAELRKSMAKYEEIEDAYKMPENKPQKNSVTKSKGKPAVVSPPGPPPKPKTKAQQELVDILERKRAELPKKDEIQRLGKQLKRDQEDQDNNRNDNGGWEWQ